jgi:hypothetical protein
MKTIRSIKLIGVTVAGETYSPETLVCLALTRNRNQTGTFNVSLRVGCNQRPLYRGAPGEWTPAQLVDKINETSQAAGRPLVSLKGVKP